MSLHKTTQPQSAVVKRMRPLLGTYVEIGIFSDNPLDPSFDSAFSTIEAIQNLMSFHHPKSELSQLNKNPGKWITLSSETLEVLTHAKYLHTASNGLFNATLGGELILKGVLPNHFSHRFESQGEAHNLDISDTAARLNRNLLITLDGIAKGYAVDKAIEQLQHKGIEGGWVNAGGDIRIFGKIELPIALRQPDASTDLTLSKTLKPFCHLQNQAMATSQIGVNASDRFPSQILHPRNQALQKGFITVIADLAWKADGLTKVLGLASNTERNRFAEAFNVSYFSHSAHH